MIMTIKRNTQVVYPKESAMALLKMNIGHGTRVIEAGTGIGKTLAYLVPAITSGKRTVVATATKALQDQLATKDLPLLAEELHGLGHEVEWKTYPMAHEVHPQEIRDVGAWLRERLSE